ncbi:dienelactone hydrolase family protein [Hydrogenophaga sp.]|jgi:carboxymethylenebutenolidase|uniref:dienelactone hydrolase family protein n=1 Tax=Hydrogenophaga sp. TaxID=1904254 RepID=UPI003F6F4243
MIERHIDLVTPDGAMNTFVVHPEENGPHPVILFFMDAPGKREELHEMARRLATTGFFVVLPNLYYRRTREFELVRDEAGMARMFDLMNSLSNRLVVDDAEALMRFCESDPAADAGRMGAVGYCMSGPFVMALAAEHPERIAAVAVIHGANMVTERPDSPHLLAPRIRCETYIACAENDTWAAPEAIATLEAALVASGTPHRLEWYAGARHGFVFPSRGEIYDKAGADRHWERLFSLFQRTLKPIHQETE